MNDKKIKALSDIQRALGIIDGASCIIENVSAGDMIGNAIEIIERSVEVLTE